MRTRLIAPVALSILLLATACGGSSKSSSSTTNTTAPSGSPTSAGTGGPGTTVHVAKPVSANPSISAKMICEKEAENDIYESATGVKTIKPFAPTWKDHVYSCDYDYPGGAKMTLSVKEVADADQTTAYFNKLATDLHKTGDLQGLGQGAFTVADGSVVVRKDFKILLIDVTKLPANFGVPADTRAHVAINVAETIMSCWSGA